MVRVILAYRVIGLSYNSLCLGQMNLGWGEEYRDSPLRSPVRFLRQTASFRAVSSSFRFPLLFDKFWNPTQLGRYHLWSGTRYNEMFKFENARGPIF